MSASFVSAMNTRATDFAIDQENKQLKVELALLLKEKEQLKKELEQAHTTYMLRSYYDVMRHSADDEGGRCKTCLIEKTPCPLCLVGNRECDCDKCGMWGCYECVNGGHGENKEENWCEECCNKEANTKQSVLNMTNEDIIKEFDKLHDDDAPLCFNEFDFDGWREYMFERGNKDPEEAIDASYMNHTEFDEEDEVWRINWEGEMPLECAESAEESADAESVYDVSRAAEQSGLS